MAWVRAVLFGAVLVTATTAGAQDGRPPQEEVSAIRQLIFDARYDEAIAAARTMLARTDLSAAERNAGLEALATVHIAQRDDAHAQETLTLLYQRDPEHRLSDPDASPVVRTAFEQARTTTREPLLIALEPGRPGPDDVLGVTVSAAADAVHELRLSYRQRGETEWTTVAMSRPSPDRGRTRLPRSADGGRDVECFVVAVAPSGHVLASAGTSESPLAIELVARARVLDSPTRGRRGGERAGGGVLSQWWFWTIVGVVVVGGGVAVGVAAGGSSTDPAPVGTLGQRRLQ